MTFAAQKFDGDSEVMTDEKTKALLEGLGAELANMLARTHGKMRFVSDTSA